MLDWMEAARRGNHRLGCQIRLSTGLDGLAVHLPQVL